MTVLLGLAAHTSSSNASISTRQLQGCAEQNTLVSTRANLLCLCAKQGSSTVAAAKRCWLRGPATYRTRSSSLFELNCFVLLRRSTSSTIQCAPHSNAFGEGSLGCVYSCGRPEPRPGGDFDGVRSVRSCCGINSTIVLRGSRYFDCDVNYRITSSSRRSGWERDL
jgi:hypothetical protein